MSKHSAHNENKSLKTFFLYAIIVFLLIIISLAIKTFFILKSSKFDGTHRFTIAIAKENIVKEVVSFDPETSSVSILQLTGKHVQLSSVGRELEVAIDGIINSDSDFTQNSDSTTLMTKSLLNFNQIETNLSLFDITRFIFLSKKIGTENKTMKTFKLPMDEQEIDGIISKLFTDEAISKENVSIQVVNATDVPGIGKRLARLLSNMGANVVAVTTSHNTNRNSRIQFYGEETYTFTKLKSVLKFQSEKVSQQPIANIVIIVGGDSRETGEF